MNAKKHNWSRLYEDDEKDYVAQNSVSRVFAQWQYPSRLGHQPTLQKASLMSA